MLIDTTPDPARLARAIRDLAGDAHRTLKGSPSPTALRGLSRRIDFLASSLGDRRDGPLGAWLDTLGREVETAARRSGSSRRLCACA